MHIVSYQTRILFIPHRNKQKNKIITKSDVHHNSRQEDIGGLSFSQLSNMYEYGHFVQCWASRLEIFWTTKGMNRVSIREGGAFEIPLPLKDVA